MKIGIIGGSGLEKLNFFTNAKETSFESVYGQASSTLLEGEYHGIPIAILSRHGRDHSIPPTQINNRANIDVLKKAGCTHIIATTACGSLKQEIGRGDIVILDQFIDFTKHRHTTFHETFENGELNHEGMADPYNAEIRNKLINSAKEIDVNIHETGTVVTIEGPRFSTRAESRMFQMWGAEVINMTSAPETILAKEAGIPYAAIALSTDYDCWKVDEAPVSWEAVLEVFKENVIKVTQILDHVFANWERL
ncbi:MAG: S-methyl-5'-thioadenosine phosphorylase [Bacteroidales bacterium]|nr:S-methyl-5'-thioadenosine phosphorylase [Bacteroidales bacterium]